MSPIQDHPLRYELANELHARPFPAVTGPSHALCLAIKQPENAAGRDRAADLAHLLSLLDRFGATHPRPGATHYFSDLGRHKLKWESHTEFVTYTLFVSGVMERPFDMAAFDVFPDDWLSEAPGACITSMMVRVEVAKSDKETAALLADWFVPESLAASQVLDASAVVAGDFRIDAEGHMRFAVFLKPDVGARRAGRIVQRITEIETYKAMSMLGLARARALSSDLAATDQKLTHLVGDMGAIGQSSEETLEELLAVSSDLEGQLAQTSFRFGATGAYEALVTQRIEVLREERFLGRQTFREFMMRRFDPAMRTVKAAERQLETMAERATRAANLLRTRVDVDRSGQNQRLLASMDERAALQLRLQKTVEGLSVVAISYYAVSLANYMLAPAAKYANVSKTVLAAIITPLVILGVWKMVHSIRKKME